MWTTDRLTPENVEYLRGLKLVEAVDSRFLIVHGSLHPEPNDDIYLSSERAIRESCNALSRHPSKANLCFFGQTHRPVAYAASQYSSGVPVEVNENNFSVQPDGYYLVNPGSVGQPRDDDNRAAFLVFDAGTSEIRFHRTVYDRDTCLAKARRAGLLAHDSVVAKCRTRIVRTLHTAMERVVRA